MKTVVLGGGSWGTALAHLLAANGMDVTILLRDEANARSINEDHINARYLPGLPVHHRVNASVNAEEAFDEAGLCILAVPCQSMRAVLRGYAGLFAPGMPVVCASKGLELGSLKNMSGVVAEELPQVRYAIISGPSFAREVMQGLPSSVVLGCAEKALGEELRDLFSSGAFRVYTSNDVTGVETGGALKNVMAIASGISDGLGFGHNARAALITRGLAEISRLGKAQGAKESTFMGLSGMGDLVLTCTGDLSRNRQVGLGLAKGKTLDEIAAEMRMVAEGVKTTEAAVELGERLGVDMPVSSVVQAVLSGELNPLEGVKQLMTRTLKDETA